MCTPNPPPRPTDFPLRVGGGGEPPTKFSKRGTWQDLNFERGLLGKRGLAFPEGVALFT